MTRTALVINVQTNTYHSINVAVLYGCETWSLTLRGEHKLRKFRNRVMKNILVLKMRQVTGERRKLHNKELHYFIVPIKYYSFDQINNNEVSGVCGMYRGYKRCVKGFCREA
jgi:hypothetical protein